MVRVAPVRRFLVCSVGCSLLLALINLGVQPPFPIPVPAPVPVPVPILVAVVVVVVVV